MPGMIQPRRTLFFLPAGEGCVVTVYPLNGGAPKTKVIAGLTREGYDAWQAGAYIQNALADVSQDNREFLMSGLDAAEWDRLFPEDDE